LITLDSRGALQIQDRLINTYSVPTGNDRPKKPVSPWPTVLVRTCLCTTRPVANFLIVATGLGFATRPRHYKAQACAYLCHQCL